LVREHFVGLVDLLELALGLGITGIDIWVVFSGQLAIRLLDLIGRGLSIDP
jgi:hypothetical protein